MIVAVACVWSALLLQGAVLGADPTAGVGALLVLLGLDCLDRGRGRS